jgi:hypothetical protein
LTVLIITIAAAPSGALRQSRSFRRSRAGNVIPGIGSPSDFGLAGELRECTFEQLGWRSVLAQDFRHLVVATTAAKSVFRGAWSMELFSGCRVVCATRRELILQLQESEMGFGRGALLWILGIPLPIILLLALFWHH